METMFSNGMCRCCASEGTFKDLSTKYRWMGVDEVYSDMLQECFNVTLSTPEDSPEGGICEVCITQLRNAANFRKQVLNTEEQFKRMIQNKAFKSNIVKVEVNAPDDELPLTDEDNNLSNDDFSSTEYDLPIKTESSEEGKSRKRSAKAGPSRSKQPKLEGESSTKPAESVIESMSDVSDTETEYSSTGNVLPETSTKQRTQSTNNANQEKDYNASQINKPATATSATQQPVDAEVVIIQSDESLQQFAAEKEDETSPLTREAESTSVNIFTKSVESKIDALTTTVTNIQINQEAMCSNQMLVFEKIANISTQIGGFMERISEKILPGKSERDVNIFKPIRNKRSLDDFEESLKNKYKAQELKKALSIICGKGKGKAINNAYALVDAMFDREFLVGCSWSGGTRAPGSKICFKSYQNTIDMFFEIVHMSDDSFTIQECNTFLKTVLRNAKQRQNSKNMRIPSQRNRTRKLQRNTALPRPDEETQAAEDGQLNDSIQLSNEENETIESANVDDVNEEDVGLETGENDEEEMLDLC